MKRDVSDVNLKRCRLIVWPEKTKLEWFYIQKIGFVFEKNQGKR